MYPRHPLLLDRNGSVIVVVDMQEPFLRNAFRRDLTVTRAVMLVSSASILNIPVLFTTQYTSRMGPVIPELKAAYSGINLPSIDKLSFSCAASPEFKQQLIDLGKNQIVLCGVETHICITQTAADLLHLDYDVYCVEDAVTSRAEENHQLGLIRLSQLGVSRISTEAAVMELTETADSPEFKSILGLIK